MAVTRPARVAVVGATGYAGAELVRLLAAHPDVHITVATSERDAGRPLAEVHRYLAHAGLQLEAADPAAIIGRAEFAFVALPHGKSTPIVTALIEAGVRVVDLGADFRFRDRDVYERWYGPHLAPELLTECVYGLTEYRRAQVASARLVANPGCYPTGALLALLPFTDRIDGTVVVDSKSGTSGAGRVAKTEQLFAEISDNLRPYGVAKHRHQPEIAAGLADGRSNAAGEGAGPQVLFAPHLVPMSRGLLSTCYARIPSQIDVAEALNRAYEAEPFVEVLARDVFPEPRNVRGTNRVEIGWTADEASGMTVLISAIDNLGKGAAGQAVQNLNVMMGIEETTGLEAAPALP